MLYLRLVVVMLALVMLGAGSLQDPKDSKKSDDPQPKLRGQLPQFYKKLGLRDDQVQKIYKVRADYKSKTEELQRQIARLKAEEKEALEKVLTAEQLKRLRELRSGEKPGTK